MDKDFAEMHATMERWIEEQKRTGWQSPEVEHYARFVLNGLWVCAHNNPVSAALLKSLAEDTAALAKARTQE